MKTRITRRKFIRMSGLAAAIQSAARPSRASAEGPPIAIGSRRELFVDDFIIDRLADGAQLRLHHPEPRELALVHDAPWEGSGSGYHSVLPAEHLYTNQVKPYHRAPHLLIGFPTRYVERGWSDSMRALPEAEHRRWRAAASERYGTAITEGLFMARSLSDLNLGRSLSRGPTGS